MATARATFVDDSGDVRLSGYLTLEDGTFTVDGPAVIDSAADPTATALTVKSGAATSDYAYVIRVFDSAGVEVAFLDTAGDFRVYLREDDASFDVNIGSSGIFQVYRESATVTRLKLGVATSKVGFFGTIPIVKPTVTGAKLPSDVALASLLTALAGLGLITDSTT